ncbi:LysR family transcriptional regulator [Rhodococcoides kroppenstedtii]|uniref:LysR family transcriptional regulator n=1 Tax=Rhodococcoides kroppenstedtii TaxID=293050 RepID=UPI001427E70C|nr:LysR family transcriptional regulator [Rhodococcus kroppenstedtii]NIL79874.1 HTH-type transcriptional regulator HdfR [Rhodococcus kroppenstedtii]
MDSRPPTVNLARLSHFVAVAESGSMTAAAADLHLTQQAVSSSIRRLERELGVSVFTRSGRRVALTPAGRTLRDGSAAVLAAAQDLARSTVATAREPHRPFVVAHTPAITADEVFLAMDAVRAGCPDLPIEVHQAYPADMTDGVASGRFDLGLRRGVVPPTRLAGAVISYDVLHAALAAEHPLADRAVVTIRELSEYPLTVWAPPGASFYTDYLLSVCRRAGTDPRIRVNTVQGTTPATAVVGTDSFAFVTQQPGSAVGGRVRIVAIAGAPQAPVQALWREHTVSEARRVLLEGATPTLPPVRSPDSGHPDQ